MGRRSITVVLPTFNMGRYLPSLWQSMKDAGLHDVVDEILFVDDGSTDDTRQVLEEIRAREGAGAKLNVISQPNRGRFVARRVGAESARGNWLLFLDSRLKLSPDFGRAVAALPEGPRAFMCCADIDTSKNVFSLYWDRSHRVIFRRHFRDTRQPLLITPGNYDRYLKGGLLICDRELFLESCSVFDGVIPLNDDTYLFRKIVERSPILVHPSIRVLWEPRDTARGFLERLWERGPSFVEYHVFERKSGPFFWIVVGGCTAVVFWCGLVIVQPLAAFGIAALALGTVAASTAVFARSPLEFVKLAPLHVAVVGTFGAAILRGLVVNARRTLRARFRGDGERQANGG